MFDEETIDKWGGFVLIVLFLLACLILGLGIYLFG